MKTSYSRFAFAALLCSGLFLINHNARAQLTPCNCLTIASSVYTVCDSCYDSTVYFHGIPDHILVCDTCYTFALTNNCPFPISAIRIYDSSGGTSKPLYYGCCVLQYAAQDTTWGTMPQPDGSIMFEDTAACWVQGAQLLLSVCDGLKAGDTLTIETWECAFPPGPPNNYPPACPDPPGDVVVVP